MRFVSHPHYNCTEMKHCKPSVNSLFANIFVPSERVYLSRPEESHYDPHDTEKKI